MCVLKTENEKRRKNERSVSLVRFFRALKCVKFSMITATCTMWFCRVALAVYLIRFQGFGPIAVWIGMFADWGIRSIIFSIRFMSGKWMEKHVI